MIYSERQPLYLHPEESNALKGIALILLLLHHLFSRGTMPVDDITISGFSLVRNIGRWSKVCVSLFVLLSGYGLMVSSKSLVGGGNLWQFYKKRYTKLMMNYWFIYMIFVPFGVFVMGRTFDSVYHGDWVRALLDFFGLHYAVTGDLYGYNPTWWFYGCILMLYAIFPVINRYKRYWWIVVPVTWLLYMYGRDIPVFFACTAWLPCFVAGIYMASARSLSIDIKWYHRAGVIFLLVLAAMLRFVMHMFIWDAVIASLIVVAYKVVDIPAWITQGLAFIGKHSFNIFLFHTFIFSLYFRPFIYWTTNSVLIFITLLSTCLLISVLLEYIKGQIGYYRLQKYLIES